MIGADVRGLDRISFWSGIQSLQAVSGVILTRTSILLALAVGGCTTVNIDGPPTKLSYGCDDFVLVGRILTMGGTTLSEPEASLPNWRSEWTLQVQVKQVVRGTELRRVVPARGISHGQIRDDQDFLIVLRPGEDGSYFVVTAALWQERPYPTLIEPCS